MTSPPAGWPATSTCEGWPRVVDPDKRRIILARHLDGESIRTIARVTKLSIGIVHTVIADHRAVND